MMYKSKLNLILNYLIISSLTFLALVNADCVLKYPDDIEKAPLYTKFFGIYSLELPYTRHNIHLKDGETINAKCRTMFDPINIQRNRDSYYYYNNEIKTNENQTSILLNCKGNQLYANDEILQDTVLTCQKLMWSIYEDNKIRRWCKQDTGAKAFLLATKTNSAHHLLAEICFDLKNWSLKSVTYKATAPTDDVEVLRDVMKTQLQKVDVIGADFWNFKSTNDFVLTDLDLRQQLKQMSEHNFWLKLANYEISSIIQGKSYRNYFREYSNHLNTIWWSNLRLGNWKRFMDTLEIYAYNNSFQLYTGTSGVVRKPNSDDPYYKTDLTIKIDFKKKPIPAYIWTYLTSTDNTNRDFVIVGYNSPYAEFFFKSEIVFCLDICDEIPWLEKISSSFRYATAGIMFCCSIESIEQFKNLDGFPMDVLISRALLKVENKAEIEDLSANSLITSPEEITTLDTEMEDSNTHYNENNDEETTDNDDDVGELPEEITTLDTEMEESNTNYNENNDEETTDNDNDVDIEESPEETTTLDTEMEESNTHYNEINDEEITDSDDDDFNIDDDDD